MKISTRLSIVFSFIASLVLVVFGLLVYFFTSNHNQQVFRERLNGRVAITEKMFLEKDSFSNAEYVKIKNQFLHTLPKETEEVIEITNEETPVFKHKYAVEIKNKLLTENTYSFIEKNITGLSKIFKVNGKNYLIIVTAVDEVGIQNLSFLRVRILLLILIAIPFIFVGSFLFTKKALFPLTDKIHHANSISASNLHQRLNVVNPTDEIGEMSIAFNNLLDRLEASFSAQKSFISNASHEIRNPLTAIMGEAEIAISKTRKETEYVESLQVILSEAEKLNLTVNNLLQLSKMDAVEGNIQLETIHLYEFLKEIKESFDFINPENKIKISVDGGGKECNYAILGNKNLLKTAIINLLDNACKFSFNKVVEVSLSQESNTCILIIKDRGIGVDVQDFKKVKTPFFRGNNTLKISGSGIGLSLSDKIITLNKGSLDIESVLGKGTEIRVKLPAI